MGAPSQTLCHSLTDKVAARIQANLDGLAAEYGAATQQSLADQVDGSGDLYLEAALMASALAQDAHSLPADLATQLAHVFSRGGFRDFHSALSLHVRGANGGSYASFDVYAAAVSALLHPLYAELVRTLEGEAGLAAARTMSPVYQCRTPTRVYAGADGSLADETTDAGDVGTADITLFGADNDALYIGCPIPFNRVVIGLSTVANATIDPLIEYWNGNDWVPVTGLTDNSAGLTRNDVIAYTLPTDWVRSAKDAAGNALADTTRLFYLRIQRQANSLSTPPVGTSIRVAPSAILNAAGAHLGVPQGPVALCRITAASGIVVEPLNSVAHARFKPPAISLRALTPFGANLTPTIPYVDQDGNDASQAQGAWTAPAMGDTVAVNLAGGDTGVRSARASGGAVTTTATEGVFEIYVPAVRTPAL